MAPVIKAFKNGHYYSVDPNVYGDGPDTNGVPWPHQPLLQLNNQLGYSATITSSDENAFIASLFTSPPFHPNITDNPAWIGGSSWNIAGHYTDPNNFYWADPVAPEYNVYFRLNGTDIGYVGWAEGVPPDGSGPSLQFNWAVSGGWDDTNPGNTKFYVTEWGQNVEGSQNNPPFVAGFSPDWSTVINAKEDRGAISNGNVKISLNNSVYGDYSYGGQPLIAIPITLGGSAIYGTDYTITAVGGQSNFVHDYSINVNYLYVLGFSSSSGIDNVDLAIIPIHNNTWSGLKDLQITLGADLSTYNIYNLDPDTFYVGSGTTQQVFIVDDEPTLSLGQGVQQSIYTNLIYTSATGTLANTLNYATPATTLFDTDGILENKEYGRVSAFNLFNSRFGMRWEGYIRIPQTASYNFTTVSNNGSATLLLNSSNSSGAPLGTSQIESTTSQAINSVNLLAGEVVWLQMDYYGDGSGVFVDLQWSYTPSGGSPVSEIIPANALFLSEEAARGSGQQGLTQTVYNPFYGATSNTLPDSTTPPSLVLRDTDGVNESDSVPGGTFTAIGLADNFGVRWEGYILISQTGTYQFQTVSDDGVRLQLRQNNATGTVLAPIKTLLSPGFPGSPPFIPAIPPTYSYSQYSIDDWTPHGPTTDTTSSITLNAGDVVWVQMDYFEAGGSATANLNWIRTPSGGSPVTEMIPASALFATEAGARGSGQGLLEPISGEATGTAFTIYANQAYSQPLNVNLGFSTTDGTTTINSGNAHWSDQFSADPGDDYGIFTDDPNTSPNSKLPITGQSLQITNWSPTSNSLSTNLYYQVYSDIYAEANEAITMTLLAGTGYGVASDTMTTTIVDQPLTLSIEGVQNATEGAPNPNDVSDPHLGWVTITSRKNGVLVPNPIQAGLSVNYTITGGTATRGTDYFSPQGTLSTGAAFNAEDIFFFPYGATEAKLYISALADAIREGNETITLQLQTLDIPGAPATSTTPAGPIFQYYLVDSSQSSATVTITDSTAWTPGVAFTPPNRTGTATIRAGVNSSASVDVHLLSQPNADVTVTLASSSGSLSAGTLTFTSSNWSTAQSVSITNLSSSANTTLTATTSSPGDSFYAGQTASQTIIPSGSTTELPLTLWEGGTAQPFTSAVTVSTTDGTEGSSAEFGFTLNLDAPRVESDLEVFFSLVAGSGFQLSGSNADATSSTTQRSYNPLLLKGGSAYANLGSFVTVGTGGVFSAEAWVRADGTSAATTAVLEFSDGSNLNDIMLGFAAGSLTPLLTLTDSAGQSIGSISGGTALVPGQWNHLAFSLDSNHNASLYLNGDVVASSLLSATPLSESRSHNWVSTGFLNGAVRDVRVWNASRSAEQIQASMLSSTASGSNLIGAWGFNNSNANAVSGGSAAALLNTASFEATTTYGIVIPVGANSADVQFTAIDDASAEGTESISLSLKGSGNYTFTPNSLSSAYLDDNDTAGVVFSLRTDYVDSNGTQQQAWTVTTIGAKTNEGDATNTPPSFTTLGINLASQPTLDPGQGLYQTIYPQFYGASASTLPDSSTPAPILIDANGINESDSVPDGTFSTIGLVDNFGVRWEGFIRIPQTGTYQFQTFSDDGVRLQLRQSNAEGTSLVPINSSTPYCIDNWTPHAGTTNTTSSISLNAGDVVWMQMDYFEAGGSAFADLNWIRTPSGGSAVTEMIPASALFLTAAGASGTAAGSDVTVTLDPTTINSGEIQVNGNNGNYSLTFNANNWNQQQQLLLQGVDDNINDGDQTIDLTFNTSGLDPDYNGLKSAFDVTNIDNDADRTNVTNNQNTSGNVPLVSISAPVPGSVAEGSSSSSSFAVTLNQASSSDTVVYFDLDRNVGNALDNDILIQPNAGSSTLAGLTLITQQNQGDYHFQVDSDGINETQATFAAKGLTGTFNCTWSGWLRIDQTGSNYKFQTHMTGGNLSLDINNLNQITGATVDNISQPISLTAGTFIPITLRFTASGSASVVPAVALSWIRPTSDGDYVTELLPANLLQRVAGRHVVIPAGSTSGGFNVTVVDDNVAEGVAGKSNQENLVLLTLDAKPMKIGVTASVGTAQAAQLTLNISSTDNREESYALAAGTVLQLVTDPNDVSTIQAYYTLSHAVTLHRDLANLTSGILTDPNGASYSGTMANLLTLSSPVAATGTYIPYDTAVNIQAISNWQPANFSAPSLGAFGLPLIQGGYASPTFVDIDADGDQDAFIGNNGSILFYSNTGSASSAAFSTFSQGAFGLPGGATGGLGYVQASSFVDIDGDGDQDAFIGSNSGTIQFFQNTGTKSVAAFAGSANAFGLTPIIGASETAFADIDHDGDFDAFIGNQDGNVLFFRNIGNNTSPQFASASTNPFGITQVTGDASPAFVDIDRDGDLDLFIGKDPSGTSSDLIYFRNTGNASSPAFASAVTNAFGLPHTELRLARPAFVDIDADGNSDVFIGYNNGSTYFFQGNSSVDLALQATNRNSVTLPVGTVIPIGTPDATIGTQNLSLTLKNALTLQSPSGGAATGTVQTASVGVSNQSGSPIVAPIQGLSGLVQVSPALQLTLLDNDTPGVFISSDAAGTTAVSPAVIALSESGAPTDRWLRLTSQPTESVTVYLLTSDPTEVLLQPAIQAIPQLTFTQDNWNIAQKFTIIPQNDSIIDGTISLQITTNALSTDPFYANLTGPSLNVSVADDDVAGLSRTLVTSTLSQVSNGFLNLQLNAQPYLDVTVTLTPDSQFTVNERGVGQAETIVFTPDNWSVVHKVELKVVDDTAVEDITHSQLSITTSSSDTNFNNLTVAPVNIDIVDNDLPTASIQLVNNSTEEAAPGSFCIKLSAPAPSSIGSDGVVVYYTISSLTLDSGLGYSNTPTDTLPKIVQTPTVSGQVRVAPGSDTSTAFVVPIDDYYPDLNDKQFVVSLINPSIGSGYQINPTDPNSTATISIINNDKAGIAIITTGSRAGTQEGSTPDTGGMFQVVLLAQPAVNAVVNVILTESSADTSRQLGTSSVPYTQTITFTSDNWYIPQTVSVYAYDDDRIAVQNGTGPGFELEDPSRPYTGYQTAQLAYRFESTDPNYNTDSHPVNTDPTYFTNTISQTVDVMDRTLSANTDIAVNNSLIALQDGIEGLALPMVGGLEGKVGSVFRGFLNTLVNSINISGTPAANQLKKIIEDNIPASNGFSPVVTLSMVNTTDTMVQFQFKGQEDLSSVPVAADLGAPALGFQSNGSFDVAFDYTAQITLVIEKDNTIYLDTTPTNTYVNASYNADIPDNFTITGGFGLLQLTGTNKASTNSHIGNKDSELDVTFGLDLNNPSGKGGSGQLSYDDLITPDLSNKNLFDYQFDTAQSQATLSVGAVTNGFLNASLPQIDFDLATSFPLFDYSPDSPAVTAPGNSSPIYIDNLKLDLGSYFSNSIQKYIAYINPILAPILPIINTWNTNIPIFESLGIADTFDENKDGKVTFLEVAQVSLDYFADINPGNLGQQIDQVFALIDALDNFIKFAVDLSGYNSSDVFAIDLGNYVSPSIFLASDNPSYSFQQTPVDNGDTSQLSKTTASDANKGGYDSNGNSSQDLLDLMGAMRGLGFSLDIIDDPVNVVKLLLNQDADIFSWITPTPTIEVFFIKDFPIEGLGAGIFDASFSMTADLGFGFDTHGLSRWRDSGFKTSEASKVLEGLYMIDQHDGNQDLPEFSFTADAALGLAVGDVGVRADILGGILGNAYFNLIDQPDSSGQPDYKIRFSEAPGLDISGDVSVYLEARVDIGIYEYWVTVWKDELAEFELFSFDFSVSGRASNGYVQGAQIFFDSNYNGGIDAWESSSISSSNGYFKLSLDRRSHDTNKDGTINSNEGHLVSVGGIDTSMNQGMKIPLAAPFGSMITPLTTLYTLGVENGSNATLVKSWINAAFQLGGFAYLSSDPVLMLQGQGTGVSGGIKAQMAYLAHAKLHFAFDQLLTTLQSIDPLILQNDPAKQLALMGHVVDALLKLPSTTPINEALATALTTGTTAWIENLSPQLDASDADIALEVARHASVTIQEFGRRLDQVVASFRDSDGPSFLAAINGVKSDGFGYFRSTFSSLTADIQSFGTNQAYLETLNSRLLETEITYAAPGGVDGNGTGITSGTANGTFTAGSTITILVPFSEAVTVTGSPTLLLQTGNTQRSAVYSAGSGSKILTFSYTVQPGDTSADLDYVSTTALQLNGGTIKDGIGDNADLILPTPGGPGSLAANADLVIDALAPTLSGTNPADGAAGVLESANIQLTFSEAVLAGAGSIQLLRADGTPVESFDVASGAGSAGGSLTINGSSVSLDPFASLLSNSAYYLTIPATVLTDAAGNAFAGISDPTSFNFSTGDSIAPTVGAVTSVNADGTYGTGARITLSLRFSEAVTVTRNGALPSLLLETGPVDRSAIYNSGSGTDTLTFAYNVEVGDASADLDYVAANALVLGGSTITDTAGNNAVLTLPTPGAPGSLAANAALVISGTIPQSLSISTGTPAVSEGSSISVALSSDTLAAGASIYWTASGDGITANDFSPSGLSGSLTLGSDHSAALSRSISLDGISEGDEQLTLSFFSDANRTVSLGQALFTLRDLVPVAVAGATDGRDQIIGSAADELISGVPTGSILNGRGSYDTLTGNGGNDTFILGTATTVYYNDAKSNTTGASDLAAITDFNIGDRIQLKGSAADYRLSSGALSGASGSFLHWRAAAGAGTSDETIGFIQSLTPAALSLNNSSQFIYL
jgi:Bacterial Ig-like domain/PA14 domain/FG-GAP-like repeat